jgi:hypothetical protein
MDSDAFSAIYAFRRDLDLRGQTSLRDALTELHDSFRQLDPPQEHPYSLADEAHLKLRETTAYNQTCQGPKAVLSGAYCYRVTTLWSMKNYTIALQPRDISFEQIANDDAFRYIQSRCREAGGWLPLSQLFVGKLSGDRGFT